MLSLTDNVGEGIMISGCLSTAFVRPHRQILVSRYLMNASNHFHKTDTDYSLSSIDDLIRFWRSNKGQVHSSPLRWRKHVDAEWSKSIL